MARPSTRGRRLERVLLVGAASRMPAVATALQARARRHVTHATHVTHIKHVTHITHVMVEVHCRRASVVLATEALGSLSLRHLHVRDIRNARHPWGEHATLPDVDRRYAAFTPDHRSSLGFGPTRAACLRSSLSPSVPRCRWACRYWTVPIPSPLLYHYDPITVLEYRHHSRHRTVTISLPSGAGGHAGRLGRSAGRLQRAGGRADPRRRRRQRQPAGAQAELA